MGALARGRRPASRWLLRAVVLVAVVVLPWGALGSIDASFGEAIGSRSARSVSGQTMGPSLRDQARAGVVHDRDLSPRLPRTGARIVAPAPAPAIALVLAVAALLLFLVPDSGPLSRRHVGLPHRRGPPSYC